ncbi:ARID DNA-binding domain-containing protein [Tanacetum coccineum]
MVNTNTLLENRWSRPSSSACGHYNMWHQSKSWGKLLKKRLQLRFIRRELKREQEKTQIGHCVRQISKECKEMIREKLKKIEEYNSHLPKTDYHHRKELVEKARKNRRQKCYGCRLRGHIISNCPNKNKNFEAANQKVKEETADQKNLFGKLKEKFSVKKLQEKGKILFIHGIREINMRFGKEIICIPGVQYTPDVTLNILSANQLEAQGVELIFKNNKCRLVYMFRDPANCKFDENKLKMMQNKYMNDYYKLLEEDSDCKEETSEKKIDWTKKCYRCEDFGHYAYEYPTKNKTTSVGYIPEDGDCVYVKGVFYPTKVSSFNEYVSFLDLIKNDDLVSQEWDIFRNKFNNAFRWFYDVYLKREMPGPIPPKINGIEIHLMDLYKIVESLGGYLSVYFAKEFGYIAEMVGVSFDYGEEVKDCYKKYLDVFKCYYSTARVPKIEQESVLKKTTMFVDQGKEYTCLQSHNDQDDQVTAPSRKDRICEEKNKVEHFGVKLEDIEEEVKKDNQHQAIYQMKIKEDRLKKGSTSAAVQEEDGDSSNNSSNDFIIIS